MTPSAASTVISSCQSQRTRAAAVGSFCTRIRSGWSTSYSTQMAPRPRPKSGGITSQGRRTLVACTPPA